MKYEALPTTSIEPAAPSPEEAAAATQELLFYKIILAGAKVVSVALIIAAVIGLVHIVRASNR